MNRCRNMYAFNRFFFNREEVKTTASHTSNSVKDIRLNAGALYKKGSNEVMPLGGGNELCSHSSSNATFIHLIAWFKQSKAHKALWFNFVTDVITALLFHKDAGRRWDDMLKRHLKGKKNHNLWKIYFINIDSPIAGYWFGRLYALRTYVWRTLHCLYGYW